MIDFNSQDWKLLSEYLEDRVQKLREKNDGAMSEECTNVLRGQIKELKLLLRLPNSQQTPTPAKTDDYGY